MQTLLSYYHRVKEEQKSDPVFLCATSYLKRQFLFSYLGSDGMNTNVRGLPQVFTLEELVAMWTDSKGVESKGLKTFLLKKCIENAWHSLPKKYQEISSTPGFQKTLFDFFTQVTQYGFPEEAPAFLQTLHSQYRAMASSLFFELETRYEDCVAHASDKIIQWAQTQTFFFLGFRDVAVYQRPLIHLLSSHAVSSRFFMDEDFLPNDTNARGPITIVSCSTVEEEAAFIGHTIQFLLTSQPSFLLHEIAIILPNEDYFQPFLSLFKTLGFPVHYAFSPFIKESRCCHFLKAFLEFVQQPFQEEFLLRFLYSPLVHQIHDPQTDQWISIDPKTLQMMLRHTDDSFSLFETFKDEDGFAFLKTLKKHPQLSPELKEWVHKEGPVLKAQYRAVQRIMVLYQAFKEARSLPKVISAINMLFTAFDIPSFLAQASAFPEAWDEITAYFSLLEFLERFSVIDSSFYVGSLFSCHSVIEDMISCLDSLRVPSPIPHHHGIELIDKTDICLMDKKILFCPGFIEGIWPGMTQENLFYSFLQAKKWGWPTPESVYEKEERLFQILLSQTQSRVIFSYPSTLKNAQTIRSHFLNGIEKMSQLLDAPARTPRWDVCTDENENMALRLNAMKAKRDPQLGLLYQGQFLSPGVLSSLKTRFEKMVYSASQLETYQNCPYQYFYSSLLKERVPEDNIQDISASYWGTVVHDILFHFYVELKKQGVAMERKNEPVLIRFLEEAAGAILKQHASHSFYWTIKRIQLLGEGSHPGLLHLFLEEELSDPLPFEPVHFEYPFSMSMEGISGKIAGKIDCILQSENPAVMAVMDYKTGGQLPTGSEIENYQSLQLPLYFIGIQTAFPQHTPVGLIFYHIKDKYHVGKRVVAVTDYGKKSVFDLKKKRPFILSDDFTHAFRQHLVKLTSLLYQGFFRFDSAREIPHTWKKRPQVCSYCPYKSVCSYKNRFFV